MLIAFVPARGGSKGIPRKNLALLGGKPLIQHTLEAALASTSVDEIFLSTDDEEIAALAAGLGVHTPYRRPPELATDEAPLIAAIEHGLAWYQRERGRTPSETLLLQPTSPLRTAQDIEGAVGQFRREHAESVVAVHRMAEHPYECVAASAAGWSYLVTPPEGVARRQDYRGRYYFINGAIYLARTAFLLEQRSFVVPGATALYEMPRERGIDVDSPLDLACAQALIEQLRGG